MSDIENSFGVRHCQLQTQCFCIDFVLIPVADQSETFDLQTTQRFLQGFLEGAANSHRFTHAFHLRGQSRIGLREFFEGETWDFDDAIIDCRLETGRRFAGNVVFDLVEGVTDRQFGRDLGNRESGRL